MLIFNLHLRLVSIAGSRRHATPDLDFRISGLRISHFHALLVQKLTESRFVIRKLLTNSCLRERAGLPGRNFDCKKNGVLENEFRIPRLLTPGSCLRELVPAVLPRSDSFFLLRYYMYYLLILYILLLLYIIYFITFLFPFSFFKILFSLLLHFKLP
jgi:hypothetical protein